MRYGKIGAGCLAAALCLAPCRRGVGGYTGVCLYRRAVGFPQG